ncbi:MAG: hypothetical protein E4H40_00635 [Candidatus Brocadiia bacterium]|nr:MAG: hypothetical protein E4H40_00635 [Candidatus Brocadiia bacterium]
MKTRSLVIGSLVMTLSLGLGYAQTPVKKDGGVPVIKPAIDIPGSGERPGVPVRKDGNITIIGPAVDLFTDSENPGVKWNGSVWYIDSNPERLIVNSEGDLEWVTPKGGDSFKTSIPKQRLSKVGDIAEMCYMFMSDGPHGCGEGRNKKCLVSNDDECYENDITCIAGTSDIRVGLYEEIPNPENPSDTKSRGYNFRFGPNMMAGPTRWVDYKGEVHKTGMFGNRGMSSNSGLLGVIPGFELEPGKYSFFRVRLERISETSILLSIKLNGRTIEYLDDLGKDMPESIDVFAVSMRNGRPYTRVVFRAI